MSPVPALVATSLAGALTLAVGLWAMAAESRPLELGYTSLDRVVAMSDPATLPGVSVLTQTKGLLDCANAINARNSLMARYLDPALREAIAPKCLAMADFVLSGSPSHSYAWFVGALAAAAEEDWPEMSRRLALSERTGPSEQWIGEQRVQLAEDNYAVLDEAARRTNDADLDMLVRSGRGISRIALRYVNDVSFRERITAIVERLPAADQGRFVTSVRRAARELLDPNA